MIPTTSNSPLGGPSSPLAVSVGGGVGMDDGCNVEDWLGSGVSEGLIVGVLVGVAEGVGVGVGLTDGVGFGVDVDVGVGVGDGDASVLHLPR